MSQYKVVVSTNLPIEYVQQIEDFMHRHHLKRKNDAVLELLKLAFYVESKMGLVQNISSEELQNIKEQIETGQLVDYVSHMDRRSFSLLMNILKDEEKVRNQKK